ncbi:MAG: AsmA-like C-terminal domain-containing protein [Alphaproteobacteria bacterium]|nr:AsmA-like C-terminal domain-containing protein [Alphaproteobacteria bacterium]
MIRKTTKIFLEGIIVGLATLVAFIAVTAWRLSEGPIALDFASSYIDEALTPDDGRFSVELESTVLTWESERRAVEVRAVGVRAVDPEGELLARAPEISISFSAAALLRGILAPTRLIIIEPRLHIVRAEDGLIRVGLESDREAPDGPDESSTLDEVRNAIPILARDLLAPPDPERNTGYLKQVRISRAGVVVDDLALGVSWKVPEAEVLLARDVVGLEMQAWVDLDTGSGDARMHVDGVYSRAADRFDIVAGFQDLEPGLIAGGLPELAVLRSMRLPIDGNLRLTVDRSGVVGNVEIDVSGGPGQIILPEGGLPNLQVAQLRTSASVTDDLRRIRIDDLVIDLEDGPALRVSADSTTGADGRDVRATIALEGIEISDTARYWPQSVSSGARQWVLENVSAGTITELDIQVEGRFPRDAEPSLERSDLEKFEITALRGALLYEGITVEALDGLPPVRDIIGGGTFDREDLDLGIVRAKLEGLEVRDSRLMIVDFDKDIQVAEISLSVTGQIGEILTILDRERFGYPSALGIKPADVRGHASVQTELTVPLISDLELGGVGLSVRARIDKLNWRNAVAGWDLADGKVKLALDEDGMELVGSASFADVPLDFRWRESFQDSGPWRRRLTAKGDMDVSQAGKFGLQISDYAWGPMDVELAFEESLGGDQSIAFDIVLDQSAIDIPTIDWTKPPGVPGAAKFTLVMVDGEVREVKDIEASAAGLDVAGNAQFEAGTGRVVAAEMARFSLGKTDLNGRMQVDEDGRYDLDIGGKSLDISSLIKPDTARGGNWQLPPLTAAVAIDRLYTRPDRYLENARLRVRYDGEDWRQINFRGWPSHRTNEVAAAAFTLSLKPRGDQRILTAGSADAGGVIWALGISDNVVGGELNVSGSIDDSKPEQPISAKVAMTDYMVHDAPVMAQVLTLASLTGIQNVLDGEGIRFSLLELPVVKTGDNVKVEDARAYGSELGFTLNGEVDLAENTADLGGTIVPAYTVNSLLGYIPWLGEILVGEKGSGVFAGSYRIKGPLDNPEVSVNPVATLTPGFLRRIFGGPGDDVKGDPDDQWTDADGAPETGTRGLGR